MKILFIRLKKKKIYNTLLMILIYRLGSFITLPFINPIYKNDVLLKQNPSYKGLINMLTSLTGGACNRASIFALGITPYISASIFTQLMCYIFPFFYKIQQDGEIGKKKLNNITSIVTIIISLIQAPLYILILIENHLKDKPYYLNFISIYGKSLFLITSIICLTTGTFFTMWLGKQINKKGIGNGNSLIIISGILSRFINSMICEILNRLKSNYFSGSLILLFEFFIWGLIIGFSIIIINFVKKIYIHYINNFSNIEELSLKDDIKYIPLKVVYSGVMPIIFSQGILFIIILLLNNLNIKSVDKIKNIYGFWYNLLYSILIIMITYFYTFLSIPVNKISDDLKLNGVYIPSIKPGKETYIYLKKILLQISFLGSILLAIIAILPSIFISLGGDKNFSLFFGGTSLLILVGVLLEIKTTVNSDLLNYNKKF
ncbi:preprotein translocase SecY subunit [Candidatus Karelsulcia muelleri CARI]|uniref:Protein translocase subunit SecY n=1 Tax=Karelsulcia muelleri (strain CARI) TaxID=706194 RepID=E0TJS8_KARMC|nr:preprotein translocase SecY subunit [Candidatus Karelsulcia muelleri CARI]